MSAELTSVTTQPIARSPWMLIPPPLLFAASLAAGVLIQRRAPLPLLPEPAASLAPWVGGGLTLLGVGLMISAVGLFARTRTTIVPHGRARALVSVGPYRFTRNPMYVALTLVYLGVTALANTVWPVPLLALPLWAMHTRVIPFEEQTLTRVFGSQYTEYASRVRRWL